MSILETSIATSYIGSKDNLINERIQKELSILEQWKAGEKVDLESVKRFGINRCFESITINDMIFNRIYKKSFKENCTIRREDLRYIKVLHYNIKQEICLGEIICNKDISLDLIEIFKVLYKA
ncbi:hypothetical protein [uncultured Parabacteroides sp.]|uniref:hypothetical protein n=1 Tax=uncultured Parabacteroides sp. TaxID=512312 RepID=UPI0026085000|nr:hypothetical protein [uncultured Parabacteroides sp.]